jgi:hypothetical protein
VTFFIFFLWFKKKDKHASGSAALGVNNQLTRAIT